MYIYRVDDVSDGVSCRNDVTTTQEDPVDRDTASDADLLVNFNRTDGG